MACKMQINMHFVNRLNMVVCVQSTYNIIDNTDENVGM